MTRMGAPAMHGMVLLSRAQDLACQQHGVSSSSALLLFSCSVLAGGSNLVEDWCGMVALCTSFADTFSVRVAVHNAGR